MNGSQLRHWRTCHDLSLRELAKLLDNQVHYSTLTGWETDENGQREIPKWASDKLLAHTQITLPLDDLHALLDLARDLDLPAQQLIAEAIRAYLAKHEHTAPHSRPATVHHPHATSSLKAAETPATYKPDPKP